MLPVLQLQCENTCLNENTLPARGVSTWEALEFQSAHRAHPESHVSGQPTTREIGSLAGKFKLSDGTATAIFPRAISDATHRKVQNKANFNNMIQNATQTQ